MSEPLEIHARPDTQKLFESCDQAKFTDCLERRMSNGSGDVACVHFFAAVHAKYSGVPFRAPEQAFYAIRLRSGQGTYPTFHWIEVAVDPGAEGFEQVERFVRYGLPVTVLLRGWEKGAPEHIERRLAWPPGDDEKYSGVAEWVDDFVKATRARKPRSRKPANPRSAVC